ncbi:cyclophilin-like fold protein [Streptomyces sp. bgisy082]|uniref:cyclophilin-like fold protein n=1 Tax=Streptomyces sp. bgisy082 TaxID=3413776 RepID=UPI003D7477D9
MTFPLRQALTTTGALLLAVTACSKGSPEQAPAPTGTAASSAPASGQSPTSAPINPSGSDRSTPVDIGVTLDGRPVDATLNDSPAARDLADLPRKLTTENAPEPVAAKAGDIAYYAPWGNLALFYQDGPAPSAGLLVLGHLDVSADQLGRATRITIEAAS